MQRFLIAVVATFSLVGQVAAQQILAVYDARLGPQDRVNSSGQPLRDVCAVVQQDRANYHRFGIRDPVDDGDPVFGDRDMRALIASGCSLEPGYEYLVDAIFNSQGYGVIVRVQVIEDGGRVRVLVSERAG